MKERFFDEHICVPLRRENGPSTNVAVLIILEKLIGYFNAVALMGFQEFDRSAKT